MKVNCDVCERAHATVLCCADDAALCASCDSRVHAANKLAGKHQRVPLLYPSPQDELPLCDICQEKAGYFFCIEDRALLCRNCDFSIHSTNTLTSKHRRFLVTGIQVALQVVTENTNATCADSQGTQGSQLSSPRGTDSKQVTSARLQTQTATCTAPLPKQISPVYEKPSREEETYLQDPVSKSIPAPQGPQNKPSTTLFATPSKVSQVVSADHQQNCFSPGRSGIDWEAYSGMNDMNTSNDRLFQRGAGGFIRRSSASEYWTDTIPGWKVDELLSLPEMPSFQATADCGSTKPETSSSGDLDWHIECNAFEEFSECDIGSDVPAVPSPPTASGIPRTGGVRKSAKHLDLTNSASGDTLVVPDIGIISSTELLPDSPPQKRMRILNG